MVNSKLMDVEFLSNVIRQSIESAMAKGRTEDVQKVMENIGQSPEIMNFRILSVDGYILKSKRPEEIGLKSKEFSIYKYSEERYKPVIVDNNINHFYPVRNKKQCFGCHNENIKINGIIEIKYDMARSMADIMAIRKFLIISSILTVMIVAGILGVMFTRMIMSPLGKFLETIRSVEGGNLDARVDITGKDELGIIGTAFNSMLNEVKALYEKGLKKEKEMSRVKVELDHKIILEELNSQLQYKIKEVETANKAVLSLSKEVRAKNIELEKMVDRLKKMNEVGRVLTSIIDIEELIRIIIRTTSEVLGVEKGSIHIMKGRDQSLTMHYQRGIGMARDTEFSPDSNPLYGTLLSEGRTVLINGNNFTMDDGSKDNIASAIGVPLKMKGQIIGGMLLEDKNNGNPFTPDELELLDTMANQAIVAIENAWLYETVKNNYFGTIQSLVNALEASDRYTKGHSERVKQLGLELAKYIGLDHRELEAFEHAAILHDIGKIGIDTSVLNKEDRLTSVEFSLIRAHPIIGDEILGPIGTLQGVRTTILQHHEKYDGTGYPYGIAGEEISLKARILSVIDTFDAMLTDRPYRRAMPLGHAVDELKKGSGTQFDPAVVRAFMELIESNEHILTQAGYDIHS